MNIDLINEDNFMKLSIYNDELQKIFKTVINFKHYKFKVVKQRNYFGKNVSIQYGLNIYFYKQKIYLPLPILQSKNINLILSTADNQLSDKFINKNKELVIVLNRSLRNLNSKVKY